MALFNTKKTETTTSQVTSQEKGRAVIQKPRITEKATALGFKGAYVFEIASGATKRDVIKAVQAKYNVTPLRVNVARIADKAVRNARTGRTGMRRGGKKAYVYLKQGETIAI